MSLVVEDRLSDAPYVDLLMSGQVVANGESIRPAETHWHMVFARYQDQLMPYVVGPWTASGNVKFVEGAEILWVRFKLGTFFSHLPARELINTEILLPEARNNAFWLKSTAWQVPDYENVDSFIQRLVKEEILMHDPLVQDVLAGESPDLSRRTLRHRFLNSTGLTQKHIQQMERAQQASLLLQQGVSILDTVFETGYYDQPHLTRSLKQFIGKTPAQIQALTEFA